MTRVSALVLAIALALVPSIAAAADEPKTDPRAAAQQLFDDALAAAQAGDFAAACPKFQASQEADPKTSTLLNLANCYEKNGQTASAWGAFREAETLARKAGRSDWESAAKQRAEALEPKLVRLSIVISEENRIAGMTVTRDGARLAQGEWGVLIPIDPGEHLVTATLDGYKPWQTQVVITDTNVEVPVPRLEELPPRVVPSTKPDEEREAPRQTNGWSKWKLSGIVLSGVGIGGMVSGALLGAVAKGDYNDARARCLAGTHACPASAVSDANAAYGTASGATVIFITGAVFLAAGVTLFLVDPDGHSKRAAHAPGTVTF